MKRALLLLIVIAACGKDEAKPGAAPKPGAGTAAKPELFGDEPARPISPAEDALALYRSACASCHGAAGAGDGAMAGALNPRPRSFADPAWQAEATDAAIAKVITEGGAAVGKSASMTARPDLKDRPDVLAELVKLIRGFGQ